MYKCMTSGLAMVKSVLSLSAGCQRNSPSEKVAITGWIFGLLWISKAQRTLQPFFKPPKFNFQPAA